jgi:hypothetical protein
MTLIPEGIAAVAVAVLILGIAIASGRQRSALRNGGGNSPVSYWPPSVHRGSQRYGSGWSTAIWRGDASPIITERQAREYHALGGRFSSDATPEIKQRNAGTCSTTKVSTAINEPSSHVRRRRSSGEPLKEHRRGTHR